MSAVSDVSLSCSLLPSCHGGSSLCGTLQLNLEEHFPRWLFPAERPKGSMVLGILLLININYCILDFSMVSILAPGQVPYCSLPAPCKACDFYLTTDLLSILTSLTFHSLTYLWVSSSVLLTALLHCTQGE